MARQPRRPQSAPRAARHRRRGRPGARAHTRRLLRGSILRIRRESRAHPTRPSRRRGRRDTRPTRRGDHPRPLAAHERPHGGESQGMRATMEGKGTVATATPGTQIVKSNGPIRRRR